MKIAIVGKMRSGKDTVARYFVENENSYSIAFGDGIKAVSKEYFPEIVAKGKPRKLYQFIGQQFRQMDKDVWVKNLDKIMNRLKEGGLHSFVVTDVRQMNEYHYLKANGFTVIKVEAEDEIRKARILKAGDVFNEEDFYHETETAVDFISYDYLISNNDSYESLVEQIKFVHEELKGESKWNT